MSAALSVAWTLSKTTQRPNRSELLRSLLRRFPYWIKGHLEYAEDALERDCVADAYASANAVLHLSESDRPHQTAAHFALGRCFLRRGDWRSAVEHLSRAHAEMPTNHAISEELAAAYVLGGDYQAASRLLEAIPANHISAAGKAARSFVRAKVRGLH
jgi:thioredoxin-like negative regulator of GroEL